MATARSAPSREPRDARSAAGLAQGLRRGFAPRRARADARGAPVADAPQRSRRRDGPRRESADRRSTTPRGRSPIPPSRSTCAADSRRCARAGSARAATSTRPTDRRRGSCARASTTRGSPGCASSARGRCCARRPAAASPRCTTRGAARSRPRWSSSRSARASAPKRCANSQRSIRASRSARRSRQRNHAGVRARRGRARPRDHPGQHQPPRARADDDRPQLPGEDQRQHRQLRRHLVDRGRGREAGLGDALGRRHRDGSLDRQEHPRDARVDPAQQPGADRHGADLPGAREGRRPSRGTHLGALPRHADRAGRAGRRLLHDPRGRAAALRAARPRGAAPASCRAAARSWRSGASRITRRTSSTPTGTRSARSWPPTTSPSRSATGCAPARSRTPTTPRSSPS